LAELVGCFEPGDESSGSMKYWDYLDRLRKYHVLKKVSAAWNLGELHY
jgi:hypothetical protein